MRCSQADFINPVKKGNFFFFKKKQKENNNKEGK